jgi:hypothetical protein
MALLVEDQAEAQLLVLPVDTDHVVEVVLVVTVRMTPSGLVEQGVTILLLLGIMVQVDLVQGVEHRLLLP